MRIWVALRLVLGFIPWEQLVAMVCSRLVQKALTDPKWVGVLGKCRESVYIASLLVERAGELGGTIRESVADGEVTEPELQKIAQSALRAWAQAKATPEAYKVVWRPEAREVKQ